MIVEVLYDADVEAFGAEPAPGDLVERQSNVGNMETCQGRVALRPPQLPPSEAMFFGTTEHHIIEAIIEAWQAGVRPPASSHLLEEVEHLATDEGFDLMERFSDGVAFSRWWDEALDLGTAWIEDWGEPNMHLIDQAIYQERKLYRPVAILEHEGERTIAWVSGHPDLATPSQIIDWKTSGRNWAPAKAQAQIQDDIYALLVEYNEPNAHITNGLFVVGDRSKGRWYEHPTVVNDTTKRAALFRTAAQLNALFTGNFGFSPVGPFGKREWPCRPGYCPAWDMCPAKYQGDEYDAQPQEVRSLWA